MDASLLIGILDNDKNACLFVPILSRCIMTSINFGEVLYKSEELLKVDPRKVESAFIGFGLQIDSFGLSSARNFNGLKKIDLASRKAQSATGVKVDKIKSLSLADIACLSYGLDMGLPILTGDKHWCTLNRYGFSGDVFDFANSSTTF